VVPGVYIKTIQRVSILYSLANLVNVTVLLYENDKLTQLTFKHISKVC